MCFLVQPNLSRVLRNDFETISAIFLYKHEFCIFPPCQIDIVEIFSNRSKNTEQVQLGKKNTFWLCRKMPLLCFDGVYFEK